MRRDACQQQGCRVRVAQIVKPDHRQRILTESLAAAGDIGPELA
jgi:hypothetical protein